ncbi:MAG: DUF1254 domain-containing protein [Alphaproteobacteria bacterium]
MIDHFIPISWSERLFNRLRRYIYHGLLIFIGAGIVHITAVMLVPHFAEKDAWSRLEVSAGFFSFKILEPDKFLDTGQNGKTGKAGATHLTGLDPLFVQAACRVQTTGAPVEIRFSDPDQFWSLGVYNNLNGVIFSLNDRTVERGNARFLIVTATQNSRIRERDPLAYERNIIVETDQDELVVVLRIYAPGAIDRAQVTDLLTGASCTALAERNSP